jgi:hypothetical protein
MYGILFDQTYINMVIFGLIVFFIMFLWRKITVMEGNMFILEKRVDMMKKSDRKDSINKNFESADIVMNEIFKDSTVKNNYCNDINDRSSSMLEKYVTGLIHIEQSGTPSHEFPDEKPKTSFNDNCNCNDD